MFQDTVLLSSRHYRHPFMFLWKRVGCLADISVQVDDKTTDDDYNDVKEDTSVIG